MPYSGPGDPGLPKNVKSMPEADREQWVAVFNDVLARCEDDDEGDCEAKTFKQANGVIKNKPEAPDHDEDQRESEAEDAHMPQHHDGDGCDPEDPDHKRAMEQDDQVESARHNPQPVGDRPTADESSLTSLIEAAREGGLFHTQAILLSEAASPKYAKGTAFRMTVIRSGMSKNRVIYPTSVLKATKHLLENRPIYVDHPPMDFFGSGSRPLGTKVGWWEDVRNSTALDDQGEKVYAVEATAVILEQSGQSWFRGMVVEALEKGHPELIGISIMARGKAKVVRKDEDDPNSEYREVVEIYEYISADAVAEPAAGGQPVRMLESLRRDAMTMKPSGAPQDHPAADPPVQQPASSQVDPGMVLRFQQMETRQHLDDVLRAAADIPDAIRSLVRAKVGAQVMGRPAIEALVEEYRSVIGAVPTVPDNFDRPGITPFLVPHSSSRQASVGLSPVEQVQLSLDHFFGVDIAEEYKGKFNKIYSIREFYQHVTGDYEFRGVYDPKRSVLGDQLLREALPTATKVVGGGTVTMANLLGTSMNRAVVQFYQAQPKWWKPIVKQTELSNMKQQDRIRLHNFGSLTERAADGAEYVELTWNETVETFSPTEYGNLVTVGRRAMINDDLRKIQALPELMAQSAVLTLNEYVSNLFTQNSGNGPTLTDAVQVFNAASHQGNRVTTPLTRANFLALRRVIMAMLNDASKRIGLMADWILVPIDLEDTAWALINTALDPDSANNTRNILNDGQRGIKGMIVVPNWTDATNWYIMSDPSRIACIELGFLFGQEEPELLSQMDPSSGMVWTNDVMSWKVRHDYGGDWIDFRGAAAAIVA